MTCAYATVFGFGGLPLLYLGDELAMLNDPSYLADAATSADNIVQAYNLSESAQELEADASWPLTGELHHEHLSDTEIRIVRLMRFPPYGAWWLTST